MAQRQQQDNVISHFSHPYPGHELVKRHYTRPFRFDMCWEDLSGAAYGCRAGCDFTIHDSCAGHSQTISSPEHHMHPLVLVQTRHDASLLCNICLGRCAPGSFLYRCPPCGFDMHTACARLPHVVRSAWHPAHDLTLVVADGHCATAAQGAHRTTAARRATSTTTLSCAATVSDSNSAHDEQIAIHAALVGSRIAAQGRNAALDLLTPSYPGSRVGRRDYLI